MNILVYNLAAEYAGALTVLQSFYDEVNNYKDKRIHWYFVVSTDKLKTTDNITVIQVPKIKKSWVHRWLYDTYESNKLIKKYKINKVFSMQNIALKNCDIEQTVFLHQSLQFAPVRYSFFKKKERIYAIRQFLISKMIQKSLRNANKIIVQTNWMRDATKKWVNSRIPKYYIVSPKIKKIINSKINLSEFKNNTFFYPAGSGPHKNHNIIIDACILLKKENVYNYNVLFTLDKEENEYTRGLYERVKENQLNIDFIGFLSKEKVIDYYKSTTLIFPSYLETFGYPLLEARSIGTLILTSDLPYSHEVLDDYNNAYFFKYDSSYQIKEIMRRVLMQEITIDLNCEDPIELNFNNNSLIDVILK